MKTMSSLTFDESYFTTKEEGMKDYQNFSHFKERAFWVRDNLSGTILEVGCAFGFLVYELGKLGVESWGLEQSSYALSQSPPENAGKLTLGDIVDLKTSYDWIISWNVLDCLPDDSHASLVAQALNTYAKNQLHVICMSGQQYTDQGYFIRDYDYWRFLFPDAYLVDHETRTMYVPDGKGSLSGVPLVKNLVSD